MGSGFSKMKKQARAFQEQLETAQAAAEKMEASGSSGSGLVLVTINGTGSLQKIKINPQCVDKEDVEGLEDLILAAVRDAEKNLAASVPT